MQKKFSQNIHHKNITKLSDQLSSWLQAHLSKIGVTEVGYSYYDIEKNHYLVVSSNNSWRYQFLEEGLDSSAINLLHKGVFLLPDNSRIKQEYNKNNEQSSYKTVFVFRNDGGFEMFGVVTLKELSHLQQVLMKRAMANLSYELYRYKKGKTSLYTDINGLELVREKHSLQETIEKIDYQKARFNGEIVLTPKEQKYIEHLLFNWSHKQIAHEYKCSQTAVRKVIMNIKRKLGSEAMPTSYMMQELKKHGVLAMFNEALI